MQNINSGIKNFNRVSDVQSNNLVPANVSYSEILKTQPKCTPVVFLKTINISQTRKVTISDINLNLDSNCNGVSNIRGASNGGIIIECESREATEKIKNMAVQKLGKTNNKINIPSSKSHMVKIVGISLFYEDDKLLEMKLGHNPKVLSDSSEVKIVQRYKFLRTNTYGVKLEVNADTFSKCMNVQRIRIQWEMCRAYEGFGIIRCYKCNEFNHFSANCTSDIMRQI